MNLSANVEQEIGRAVSAMLSACVARKMTAPFTIAALGKNGSVIVVRYSPDAAGGFIAQPLAHVFQDGVIVMPINILIVDAFGATTTAALTSAENQPLDQTKH